MKRHQQGELLPMVKFREIIRLHEMGHSQCAIARSCLVARSTVQDYIRRANAKGLTYAQLCSLSDSDAQSLLGKGKRQRPSQPTLEIDFQAVHLELQHKGVTRALVWQEGIDEGKWDCSYGGFCRRYQHWCAQQNLSMRQHYKGGDNYRAS